MYLCGAGARRVVEAHRRRQILVVNRNLFGGVLREQRSVGDDQRDGLADVVHVVARERRPVGFLHLLSADALESDAAGERFEAGRIQVRGGEHEVHARAPARRLRVDAEDFRVRAVGAEKMTVELARKIPVGGVAAPSGQQALVFAADGFVSHGFLEWSTGGE